MATFKVANTQPTYEPSPTEMKSILSMTSQIRQKEGTILTYSSPEYPVWCSFENGFIGALYDAYSQHRALVLRPDDVWLAITMAFANYVDYHAEEMRGSFVNHEGKKDLVVEVNTTIKAMDWDDLIRKFSILIDENTKDDVRAWLEPAFSTTTPKDRLIGRVVLMGAMKHYFSYVSCCTCGIPEVTLEGTLEDWQEVRRRIDRLSTYKQKDLQKWWTVLVPVIDQFIASYSGKPDLTFWNGIVDHKGGSGVSYVTGWALVFAPFSSGYWNLDEPATILATGKYGQIDTGKLKMCTMVEVPVQINDHGVVHDVTFFAGAFVGNYHADTNTLRPSFDWAIVENGKSEKTLPAVNPLASAHGLPETYEDSNVHAHLLRFAPFMQNHTCDVCRATIHKYSYRCHSCDFDMCLECLNDKTM